MYTRLHTKRTKKYYREIVNLAIEETKNLMEMSPKVAIYASIYNQLVDIKQNIIEENKVFSRFELYKRYSLGMIAVKNFGLMVKCTPERGHNALFFIPLQVFIML